MVEEYLAHCASQSQTEFTFTLKQLEKEYGTYPHFKAKDAQVLFDGCEELYRTSSDPIKRSNALRLIKYAVTSTEFLKDNYQKIWEIIKDSSFHSNGHIRNAGIRLLSRYRYGISWFSDTYSVNRKKKYSRETQKEIETFDIQCWKWLLAKELTYIAENDEQLDEDDIEKYGQTPFACDTRDKRLKQIRRLIEEYPMTPAFQDMLARYGYDPRPPEIIEQDQNPLPDITLKHHDSEPHFSRENEVELPLCDECNKKMKKIGAVYNAYDENPTMVCEKCAIDNFQEDWGFRNRKAAVARRRRMFDVPYLFNEIVLDEYMLRKHYKSFDDIDFKTLEMIAELCRRMYTDFFTRDEKISLELTRKQSEIESLFGPLIKHIDIEKELLKLQREIESY